MKLENQVCNLELSKKLKELHVDQMNNLFYWLNGILVDKKQKEEARFENNAHSTKNQFYSAFTVAELGERLPKWFSSHRDSEDGSEVVYVCEPDDFDKIEQEFDNMMPDSPSMIIR